MGAALALAILDLGAASLLSLACVRVGFDLWAGIDPLLPPDRRPPLGAAELARRALAVDALRQAVLAALVFGAARWRDPAGWRARLGLDPRAPGAPRAAPLLLLFLAWPALHVAWVAATAAWFGAGFERRGPLPPGIGPAAAAAWIALLALLAPAAEELLLRGAVYARAREAVGEAGAAWATALVFCAAHASTWGDGGRGLARPVSLLPLALVLGLLRWRTGRLWPCVALHGWSNLALVACVLRPG